MTTGVSNIDNSLVAARSRLRRLTAAEVLHATKHGAVIIDIRPEVHRFVEGEIPGAVAIERNVLEWRLDPTSQWRHPDIPVGTSVVLVCNEGYASSLAASDLLDLGVDATDLIGGYRAWRASGFPTRPYAGPTSVDSEPGGRAV